MFLSVAKTVNINNTLIKLITLQSYKSRCNVCENCSNVMSSFIDDAFKSNHIRVNEKLDVPKISLSHEMSSDQRMDCYHLHHGNNWKKQNDRLNHDERLANFSRFA